MFADQENKVNKDVYGSSKKNSHRPVNNPEAFTKAISQFKVGPYPEPPGSLASEMFNNTLPVGQSIQQKGQVVSGNGTGMPDAVNDNPVLEKEADVMGDNAAQGKLVRVNNSTSDSFHAKVDKNKPTIIEAPYIDYSNWLRPGKVGNLKEKGAIYRIYTKDNGEKTPVQIRYIITTTKENWSQLLKYGDQTWYAYIYGFLHASMDSSWLSYKSQNILEADMNGKGISDTEYFYTIDPTPITNEEKADFLEALYSIGKDAPKANLPQRGILSKDLFAEKRLFPELGRFISQNQQLLLNRITKNDFILSSEGIQNIASYGIESGNPLSVQMISNAFATAVASSKSFIAEISAYLDRSSKSYKQFDNSYLTNIHNSKIIIDDALKGYNAKTTEISERTKAIFNIVWDSIPIGSALEKITNPLYKIFAEIAINEVKNILIDKLSKFGDNCELSTINEYSQEFRHIIKDLEKPIRGAAASKNISITLSVESLLESMKNTF